MVCTYATRADCSMLNIIFTCDTSSTTSYCYVTKSFLIINIFITFVLLRYCYIYVYNRQISLKDPRIGIIMLATTLSCFNWLNYSFLIDKGTISIIYTLNSFLYFFESLYFMLKALSFQKYKKKLYKSIFIA